ncbi:MAG: GNAT family protein [Euryarchaeota archaeon]|nr:GNAT family protein [Euryarchaeota archaeon]
MRKKAVFLAGERIYLRPVEQEDVLYIHRWLNDPEIRTLEGELFPRSISEEKEWLEKTYKDNSKLWFIIALRKNDKVIGDCGLLRIDYTWRTADLSMSIGEKDEWNRGYGTEAMYILLEYGFKTLNLHRVGVGVFEFNKRAIKTYEKVGFRREGVLRDGYYCDSTYHDVILMSILEDEF